MKNLNTTLSNNNSINSIGYIRSFIQIPVLDRLKKYNFVNLLNK